METTCVLQSELAVMHGEMASICNDGRRLDLAVNVMNSQADLHKHEHDGVLVQQLPGPSLHESVQIPILHACPGSLCFEP